MYSYPLSKEAKLCLLTIALMVSLEFMQNAMVSFSALSITHGFHGTAESFSLAASLYAGTAIFMIAIHHWIADRLGYRRMLHYSLALFAIGAVICATANTPLHYIIGRVVQALGGATFFTGARVLVNYFKGPSRLDAVRALITGLIAFSGVGVIIATLLLTFASWRWIFLVPLIVIVPVWLLVNKVLSHDQGTRLPSTLHPWSAILLVTGVLAIQILLERIAYDQLDTRAAWVIPAVVGIGGLIWFIRHEYQRKHALLPFSTFSNSPNNRYLAGMTIYGICYLVLSSGYYILPVFLGKGLGYSVAITGSILAVTSFFGYGMAHLHMYWVGKHPGHKKYLFSAFLVLSIYSGLMWLLAKDMAGVWVLPIALISIASFASLGQGTAALNSFIGIDEQVFSQAYQSKNMMREVLISTGISLSSLLLHHAGAFSQHANVSELVRNASAHFFTILLLLGVVGMLVSLWQKRIV